MAFAYLTGVIHFCIISPFVSRTYLAIDFHCFFVWPRKNGFHHEDRKETRRFFIADFRFQRRFQPTSACPCVSFCATERSPTLRSSTESHLVGRGDLPSACEDGSTSLQEEAKRQGANTASQLRSRYAGRVGGFINIKTQSLFLVPSGLGGGKTIQGRKFLGKLVWRLPISHPRFSPQIFKYVGQSEVSLLLIREAFSLLKSTFISSLLKTCNGINQSTLEYADSNAAYK